MANTPSTPTRRYSASSRHEFGFVWNIEAPASLSSAEVERLHEALVHWSDDPAQSDLDNLLADEEVCEEYRLVSIDDLNRVRFTVRLVHGEQWSQDVSVVREGGAS